jgi:hypothetical protein
MVQDKDRILKEKEEEVKNLEFRINTNINLFE